MGTPAAGRGSPWRWLPFAVALPLYLGLVWRFDSLCDDAHIFFRFAANLAEGRGFVFNPGERVEGYSSVLWPLWQAAALRLGLALPAATRVVTVAVGLAFFVVLVAFVRRRFELGTAATTACALFLASFPPFALWSTGGMSDLAHAFAVFATFERLLGDPRRPRGLQAGLCALLAAGLRAEGALFAALVLCIGAATALAARDGALWRACRIAAAVLVLGVAVHVLWRLSYYGDFVANTARTKGGTSPARLLRGVQYSATWFAIFPGMAFALVASLWARGERRLRFLCWTMFAAALGFATAVGGDFMPMGRFLLAGVPFCVVLLAAWLAEPRRANKKLAATLAAGAASLLAAFDVHLAPLALRKAIDFRAGRYYSEFEVWRFERDNALRWGVLGRAVREHTLPGESILAVPIGALGFYSDRRILDQCGLVSRIEDFDFVWELGPTDPGHDRFIPPSSFLPLKPTYLDARLVPKGSEEARAMTRNSPWSPYTEASYHPVSELSPEGQVELELVRFTRWEWFGRPFSVLVDLVRGVDLRDASALATLAAESEERAADLEQAEAEIVELARSGFLFDTLEPHGVRQVARAGDLENLGYQVLAWRVAGAGIPHPAPRGSFVRSISLAGEPSVDGAAPGWSIVAPGSLHAPTSAGGTSIVVCLRPPDVSK